MSFTKRTVLFSLVFFVVFFSCKRDKFITDDNASLGFSTDSLLFDTIFTTVGSATRNFMIRNPYNKPIRINSISLAGGAASNFRINVDGISGTLFNDVEIPAKDSIFLFAEVTVDPTNKNSPIFIGDAVVFNTNGHLQKVVLGAWGQDVYFHRKEQLPCNIVWNNDKPHVIYDYAAVMPGCELLINEGTHVYLHMGASLVVLEKGTLLVKGTKGKEVVFQGDRTDGYYGDKAGQWGTIFLQKLSRSSEVEYAIIKNATYGIVVDSFVNAIKPTLTLKNTIITNTSMVGIWGRGARVDAYNSVISKSEQYTVALDIGGRYNFYHCTLANYLGGSARKTETLFLSNYYVDINKQVHNRALDSANFYNCIIYGSKAREIKFDSSTTGTPVPYNYKFVNCTMKWDTAVNSHFNNTLLNQDPLFKDYTTDNYMLLPGSAVIDKGAAGVLGFNMVLLNDLKGDPRNIDAAPDIGAYEFKK